MSLKASSLTPRTRKPQQNPEGAALSRIAFNFNLSLMLLDDPVGDSKPRSSSDLHSLGCKSWIEDPTEILGRDPCSIIGYLYSGKLASCVSSDDDIARVRIASIALTRRFMKTWFSRLGRHVIGGIAP